MLVEIISKERNKEKKKAIESLTFALNLYEARHQ